MNLFKSIFISGYMMLISVTSALSGWNLYQLVLTKNQDSQHVVNLLAWGGALLSSVPMLITLSLLLVLKKHARTSRHLPIPNLLSALGVVVAIWAGLFEQTNIIAAVLATLSWAGFLLYAYWYSILENRRNTTLVLGNALPSFNVLRSDGLTVTSKELTDKPAILIFYRGNWCPLCMAQIKEIVARYQDIASLGVRIALIAPQPHQNTIELANRFNVTFEFFTDEGNAAARSLGIQHVNGLPMGMQVLGYDSDTVMPTVIITDRHGKIVWTHETDNYRVRPEPDLYLDALRQHGLIKTH